MGRSDVAVVKANRSFDIFALPSSFTGNRLSLRGIPEMLQLSSRNSRSPLPSSAKVIGIRVVTKKRSVVVWAVETSRPRFEVALPLRPPSLDSPDEDPKGFRGHRHGGHCYGGDPHGFHRIGGHYHDKVKRKW
ncbi:hypothetical protein GW17_00035783 [Ensete ventricosum]|nr:hypothetical protein GW17_00035783 [Ensete ventricosum]